MIKNIEGKKIKIILKPGKVDLSLEVRKKVAKHWKSAIKKSPALWNGEIICVLDYTETDDELEIICQKSDYAHYLYDERIGLEDEYKCCNLYSDSLMETQDGYYIIGEMDEKMSYPFCLQLPGGNVDKNDLINNNEIDVFHAVQREVLEELNIDLDDERQIEQNKIKYLVIPGEISNGYGIVTKTKLKIKAEQMQELYEKYLKYLKENNFEVEFEKIHFIKKENALQELEKMQNPKREYLKPLIEKDCK